MHKLKLFWLTAAAVALCACGDDETLTGGADAGGGGGVGTGGGTGGGGTTTNTVRIGSGFGTSFQQGMLQLGVTSLGAGGSTGVTATLVTSTGDLYTTSGTTAGVDVTFNSPCVGQGLATVTTPVKTATGIASATYAATGCSGPDVITATATVNGTTMTANGTVTVAAAGVGSIQFISATPTNIALQGAGGAGRSETSTVIFKVVDATGGPVANTNVAFALNSTVGNISLSPAQASTNAAGQVQTVVKSGTVATTVRVTATVVAATIGTQSDQLTITTGIPDQDSASLSVEKLNVEARYIDGVIDPVTMRMSDRFNNPVPDGTAVTFTSEGGQVVSQCLTAGGTGACSVNWTSQNPRPVNGRMTILATAIGEESFTDVDGNGRYGAPDSFQDIPEPFRDDNEDGVRQSAEPFFDFNTSGAYDVADGQFNGLLCDTANPAGDCSPTASTIAVNASVVITATSCSDLDATVFPVSAPLPFSGSFAFRDLQMQPLPVGTTIKFATTNGTLQGPATTGYTYPNTLAPQTYGVFVAADTTLGTTGVLTITVTCPSGLIVNRGITLTD